MPPRLRFIRQQTSRWQPIRFVDAGRHGFGTVCPDFRGVFAQPEITAMKRTKKGEREISLKEHLHGLSLQADGDMVLLSVQLPAGNELNINPTLVLDAFGVQTGMLIDRLAVQKTAVLTKDGKNFA